MIESSSKLMLSSHLSAVVLWLPAVFTALAITLEAFLLITFLLLLKSRIGRKTHQNHLPIVFSYELLTVDFEILRWVVCSWVCILVCVGVCACKRKEGGREWASMREKIFYHKMQTYWQTVGQSRHNTWMHVCAPECVHVPNRTNTLPNTGFPCTLGILQHEWGPDGSSHGAAVQGGRKFI